MKFFQTKEQNRFDQNVLVDSNGVILSWEKEIRHELDLSDLSDWTFDADFGVFNQQNNFMTFRLVNDKNEEFLYLYTRKEYYAHGFDCVNTDIIFPSG